MSPKRYGNPKSRRLPDTYDSEVTSAVPPRGGKSVINPEQFEFLGETDHLRPSGDSAKSRRLQDMKFMSGVEHLMRGSHGEQAEVDRGSAGAGP